MFCCSYSTSQYSEPLPTDEALKSGNVCVKAVTKRYYETMQKAASIIEGQENKDDSKTELGASLDSLTMDIMALKSNQVLDLPEKDRNKTQKPEQAQGESQIEGAST